jgi:hypothetical protein
MMMIEPATASRHGPTDKAQVTTAWLLKYTYVSTGLTLPFLLMSIYTDFAFYLLPGSQAQGWTLARVVLETYNGWVSQQRLNPRPEDT